MIDFDYTNYGTAVQLKRNSGFEPRLGWVETDTDTIYCEVAANCQKVGSPPGPYFRMWVWNRKGARAEVARRMAEILGNAVQTK